MRVDLLTSQVKVSILSRTDGALLSSGSVRLTRTCLSLHGCFFVLTWLGVFGVLTLTCLSLLAALTLVSVLQVIWLGPVSAVYASSGSDSSHSQCCFDWLVDSNVSLSLSFLTLSCLQLLDSVLGVLWLVSASLPCWLSFVSVSDLTCWLEWIYYFSQHFRFRLKDIQHSG